VSQPIEGPALDQIFHDARSYNGWLDKPVSKDLIDQIYQTLKFGPTSGNGSPARFVFLSSKEAKERLVPYLLPTNVDKVVAAPVGTIVAHDLEFYENIPHLFPHNPGAKAWFEGNDALIDETVNRNGSLQGAYLMIAARAHGLDCGPMSGFDRAGVDREFFDGTAWRSNFLCSLGHGDPKSIFDRSPRLSFDEACLYL
jgi:3-hydroxypropanoate dehydrogenase